MQYKRDLKTVVHWEFPSFATLGNPETKHVKE